MSNPFLKWDESKSTPLQDITAHVEGLRTMKFFPRG